VPPSSGGPSAVAPSVTTTAPTSTTAAPPPTTAPPPAPPVRASAAAAVAAATSQLGVKYQWGGDSPKTGFDCSGLTFWSWGQAGRVIPHNAADQYNSLPKVPIADLQPGDLVFFGRDLHHVGIFIGNGQMIHAPYTGDVVKIATIYRADLVIYGARP
jgi:cell wall-associated NlpC family hydrolase